jgi:regulator of sigma E protease
MSIILSLIVFSVLVLVHEFGHFLLAKKNGIGVTEFSLGMGPRIASFKKGGTRYSWKLIPFGGSCMMVGEDEESQREDAFDKKSVWARISVVAAGPIFNFVLALVLSIVYIGLEGYDQAKVTTVSGGYAAEEAGLQVGDVITEYDGKDIVLYRDLWLYQYVHPVTSSSVKIKYERDGKEYTTTLAPTEYYSMGISYIADDNPCEVTVSEGTAVYEAGLKSGDILVAVDGNEVSSGKELYEYMGNCPLTGDEVVLTVKRDGKETDYAVTPKKAGYTNGFGYGERVKTNALGVLRYSFTELRYDIESTLTGFKLLFTGKASKDDVSGPVGIVKIVGDSYEETKDYGAYYVFLQLAYFTILFSVNLGVLNLFPFPALDGGRLVFLFIEAIRGKRVPKEREAIVHFAGMVVLMILMVLILFNDVSKFF